MTLMMKLYPFSEQKKKKSVEETTCSHTIGLIQVGAPGYHPQTLSPEFSVRGKDNGTLKVQASHSEALSRGLPFATHITRLSWRSKGNIYIDDL